MPLKHVSTRRLCLSFPSFLSHPCFSGLLANGLHGFLSARLATCKQPPPLEPDQGASLPYSTPSGKTASPHRAPSANVGQAAAAAAAGSGGTRAETGRRSRYVVTRHATVGSTARGDGGQGLLQGKASQVHLCASICCVQCGGVLVSNCPWWFP